MSNNKSRTQVAKDLVGEEVFKEFSNADPSSSNKYVIWMAKQFNKGYSKDEIIDVVDRFNRRSKSCTYQDIYQYKDLRVLEAELGSLSPSKSESKDLKTLKDGRDYIKLLDKGPIRLYYILTYKAMKNLGKHTKWCIQANEGTFNSYQNNSHIFVLVNDSAPVLAHTESSPYNRLAILEPRDPKNRTRYNSLERGWRTDDIEYEWREHAAENVRMDVEQSIFLVCQILNDTSLCHSRRKHFSYGDNNKLSNSLLNTIRKKKLFSLLARSNNKTIIKALKNDIVSSLGNADGKIIYSDKYSKTFINEMKNHLDFDLILNDLPSIKVTAQILDLIKPSLDKLSNKEYKELMNKCSARTIKLLLARRINCWRGLKPEKVTSGIATYLCIKIGTDAVPKGHRHFGKKASCYGYTYDNSYTDWVKSHHLTPKVIKTLRKKPDLNAEFSNYLDKFENKSLTKTEKNTIKKAIDLITKSEGIDVDELKIKQVKFFYQKAIS